MGKEHRLLIINVGSTSTKVAYFRGKDPAALENIRYRAEDLVRFSSLEEQLPLREEDVMKFLEKNGVNMEELDMVVSRGGLGKGLGDEHVRRSLATAPGKARANREF